MICSVGDSPPPVLEILYRDPQFVVVVKPPGLMVHRSRESQDRHFLLQMLRDQIGELVYPVHRIDRATSGVLAFALSPEAARDLQESLAQSGTRKDYLTFARGSTADRFESQRPLTNDRGVRQPCHTTFVKLGEVHGCSLLQASLHTGRRHQIRRHLAHLAHQVIGDTTYGKGRINRALREEFGLPRMFLHSWRLTLRHPKSNQLLTLCAPLADDLLGFLDRLPGFRRGWLRGVDARDVSESSPRP